MIQVKTPDGYKLPDNIFYKNGSTFVQVKKVYSNQRVLERTAICSCELGTSKLIKSLRALIVTYTDLINYTAEPEKSELINAVAEMENEIESLKIDQLIYNQQLTIIDNDRDLRNQVIPAVYGLNLVTEYAINNTPNPQIAVKIVVGNNTVNPDIEFSPLPANMFKYNGDYYYVGNQSDQTTILENITSIFGEGKVALQVYSANEIIDILRVTVTERSALNIAQLRKIGIQQDLIDSAVSARRLKVLIDSTLEDSNTDSAVKAFYEVASITDVVDGNITSTTIKMNVDLRMSNLLPTTKLDIKTPLFPFTLDSLNTKSDEILGYTNLVKNVNVSPIISPSAMTQIYTSSDIHEFKFDKMGRVYSGVKDTIVNQPIEQNTYTYTTNIPVTLDATWSGGVNYTVTGTTNSPIITTNGQFATALWKMTGYGRTGKVYLEVDVKSKNTTGGVYIGIQRVPTKKGNYHNGTSSNGNGGISLSSSITTPIGKHSVVIDLSTGELIIDGVSLGILGGTGDVYFGVYDGDSAGTGQIQLFFHPQDYTLQVPANVSTWIESTKHTTYLDNYVDVLSQSLKHSYITSAKDDTLYVLSANVKSYIDVTVRDNVITEIYNRVKSLEESVKLSTSISHPISYVSDTITATPMKVAFISNSGRRVVSEMSNVIEIIPENVLSIPTTNETKRYIISQISNSVSTNLRGSKLGAGVSYTAQDLYYQVNDIFRDSSTLAYYPLNGNANDALGNYNPFVWGTMSFNQYVYGERTGTGLYFDGVTDKYMNTGVIPNAISVSMWVTVPVDVVSGVNSTTYGNMVGGLTSTGFIMIGNATQWYDTETFTIITNGSERFHSSQTIPKGINHFVMTYNTSLKNWSVYMNGLPMTGIIQNDTISVAPVIDLWLGEDSARRKYTGLIDQVRVFNRPLTQSDVTLLYNEATLNSSSFIRRVEGFRESDAHSKIISKVADTAYNMQETVLTTALPHKRVISLVDAVPYLIGDVIATAVSHPELATPTSDVVQLTTGKVKLNSVIIPIISNVESPILNVVENVNAVNDPIPFTVYQQSIGSVCQFGKPIIEPSSIDIYVSSVKNIGAMSRIDPIMVISDKIPNYISTQTNMTSVINVSDVVTGVVSIDSYVVSQLSLISPTLDIPKCDVQPVEIYVAENKSNNVASFDTIVKLNTPEISSYIVSSINENVASFEEVIKVTNTVAVSNAIIDVKSNKTISFDDDLSGIVLFSNESNDKVIDVKSNKVLSFDMDIEGIMNFNNESNDKIIDVKSNKVLSFDMDVDTSLNSGETVFIISNGLAYSSTDINNLIVVTDSLDGKNYAVTRGTDGIIESYETTQSVTKNNYFYDEITKLTYKITSSGGFLDMVAM